MVVCWLLYCRMSQLCNIHSKQILYLIYRLSELSSTHVNFSSCQFVVLRLISPHNNADKTLTVFDKNIPCPHETHWFLFLGFNHMIKLIVCFVISRFTPTYLNHWLTFPRPSIREQRLFNTLLFYIHRQDYWLSQEELSHKNTMKGFSNLQARTDGCTPPRILAER